MKYKTYYQLKRMSKQEMWDYGVNDGSIDTDAQNMGCWYFSKGTVLEMLSVNHREWNNNL